MFDVFLFFFSFFFISDFPLKMQCAGGDALLDDAPLLPVPTARMAININRGSPNL
jgi:hypothetical protein